MAAEMEKALVRAVVLASGERVAAEAFVNAAGAWSGEVAAMFGMKLPVTPMRRFEHYFTAGSPIERLPYVKDVARLAFRSEGKGFSGGLWRMATSVAVSTSRSITTTSSRSYGRRWRIDSRVSKPPVVATEVTAPGQGSTSRTSWTAIP